MPKNSPGSWLASTAVAAALFFGGEGVLTAAPPTAVAPTGQRESTEADGSNCRGVKVQPGKQAAMTFGNETQSFRVYWPSNEIWRLASSSCPLTGKSVQDPASGPAGLAVTIASEAVTIAGSQPGSFALTFVRVNDGQTFVLKLSRPAQWADDCPGSVGGPP